MYTDINFENHSHLLTTSRLTLNKQYSLHILIEEISTERAYPFILYSPYYTPNHHALHVKGQPEVAFE